MTELGQSHIEIVEKTVGRRARVKGTRVLVSQVVTWHEHFGWSPDEIVDQVPQLSLADVHAALAYYWDHREEVERQIAEDDAFVEEFKQHHGSPLMERLRKRLLV